MSEIWAEKSQPSVRLVLKGGSGLPAELGARDWIKVGPITLDPAIAAAVEAKGYAFFETGRGGARSGSQERRRLGRVSVRPTTPRWPR